MGPGPAAMKSPAADRLEMQRRMRRIGLELRIAALGERLNVRRQRLQALPEPLRCSVPQSSRADPARWSASALAANVTSLPDTAPCSICRSQAAASKSANQRRNSASSVGGSASMARSIDFTFARLLAPIYLH
jgi:hypothetical protein